MIITGKHIRLKTVTPDKAGFILSLRQHNQKSQHLTPTSGGIKEQKEWIQRYQQREKQQKEYYFVIQNLQKEDLGLVRVYDLRQDSFCWGSWLIKDNAPKLTAIRSALAIYAFGFETLGYTKSHFDVRHENKRVLAFHLRMGAQITHQDSKNLYLEYTQKQHQITLQKYKRFSP